MGCTEGELSALRSSIKEKGEFSYYYAHKNDSDDLKNAKIFEGPGIVTGGEPILVHKDEDVKLERDRCINLHIKKYSWSDCGESIEIYIMKGDLVEMLNNKSEVEIVGKPILDISRTSISLQFDAVNKDCNNREFNQDLSYKFHIKINNLSNPIDSELSRIKISSKKITVICFKEDSEIRWTSLCRPII